MLEMTAEEFQIYILSCWPPNALTGDVSLKHMFEMTAGLGGECGEVQEILKKRIRDGVFDREKLKLELGDVLHYTTVIATVFGLTLGEIMEGNKAKLDARKRKRRYASS